MKPKPSDEDVRSFVHNQRGVFLTLSDDPTFAKNLRATLIRHLSLKEDSIRSASSPELLQKEIKLAARQGKRALLFIEREFAGRPTTALTTFIKADNPDFLVIVLTSEIGRDKLVLLHEAGISNFITKPVSPDTLIEKIATTVKPPSAIGQLMDEGRAHLDLKNPEAALAVARKILDEIKPGSPAAFILMGDAYKALGKRLDALTAYNNAAASNKLYLDPLKRIADLHREDGDLVQETKYLEKLDRLSPLNIERKVAIGGNYVDMGDRDRAQEYFTVAVKTATREAMTEVGKITRAIAERCLKNAPELSERYLRDTLEARKGSLDASDIETFNRLGLTLRKQGKWREAIEEYHKALTVSPRDENLFYNLAMAHAEGKNFQEAEKNLLEAIRISPDFHGDSEIICFNIAMIFHRASRTSLAVTYLKKALQINPEFENARKMLQNFG
ncbi:MAG: tetratricopeptide repeat protein [Desulfovibrionaceae bacterium]|nr:tetratricopeptide repeat protein [Desulfovibrionaceae bacterium]MBF0512711.1 tetratricopeptide repeat protein [Desulfovibrionaceae bacterium]